MISNNENYSLDIELLIRGGKLKISLVFITQSYFLVPKDVRVRTSDRQELQKIATNHSSDIDCKDFANIHKKCIAEPYSKMNYIHFCLLIQLFHLTNLYIFERIYWKNNNKRTTKNKISNN